MFLNFIKPVKIYDKNKQIENINMLETLNKNQIDPPAFWYGIDKPNTCALYTP